MLAYRSTFNVKEPVDTAVPKIQRVMIEWAERKHRKRLGLGGLDELHPGDRLRPADGLEFFLVDSVEDRSGERIFGFVVIEGVGEDKWTSQVMVAGRQRRSEPARVSVEIDAPPSDKDRLRPRDAGVPRFVRTMLDSFECEDNGIVLASCPQVLGLEGVASLLDEIQEDDHHGLVLVAGTSGSLPLQPWVEFLKEEITADTVGQAATYVLDAEATSAFNERVSDLHEVREGSLRTFLPGVRINDPDDAARHRFLTAQSLADDYLRRRAKLVMTRRSRAFTNVRALDRRTRRCLALLGQHLDAIEFKKDPTQESTPVTPLEGLPVIEAAGEGSVERSVPARPLSAAQTAAVEQERRRVVALTTALAVREDSLRAARDELVQVRHEADLFRKRVDAELKDLVDERDSLAAERDELDLNLAVALEEKGQALTLAQRHGAEVERLRRCLEVLGRGAEAWKGEESTPAPTSPEDWPALAEWAQDGRLAQALPLVDFTCDWECAIDLDDQNEFSWFAKTWDILRALNDYARARKDESVPVHNLYDYLSQPPEGFHSVPRSRYKPTESETVANRERYRRERVLPVPEQVPDRNDQGRIYMDKHFVIAQSGTVSPRLYLHDATGVPGYGKVVVGYIGRHLANSQTN